MASVDVIDFSNNRVGSLDLNDSVFAAPVNEHLIYEAVRHYLASRRGGNAKVKRRSEVSGSGKKLWRQKGTGRARMGSIRSPIWRHGGTVHGPVVRDYSYKLPRKMLLGALRSALSAKLRDGELRVVNEFSLSDHKTKNLARSLKTLGLERTVLLVDVFAISADGELDGKARNLALSSRNIEGVKLVPTREVTVYDLLSHKQVLLSQAAATKLSEALAI
jgi:large subunit ribosomal protein L4